MSVESSSSQSRLSTRISLRWVPEPAFENTDTIVMSVAGWYVDLRVDKKSGAIDWAIAGQRVVDSTNSRTHSSEQVQFTHELDSQNSFDAVDCGTFSTLPNGDDLEQGSMPRADLPGCPVAEYEEVWRELEFRAGPDGPGKGTSWVIESQNEIPLSEGDELEVNRTFLGKVWGTYLALRQVQIHVRQEGSSKVVEGKGVSARREEWDAVTGWQVKYCLGAGDELPSMNHGINDSTWKLGQTVLVAGKKYIVRGLERTV
ncbi:hypothetical protein BO70DRAFT_364110 [Aspergillus heteromorphus CBS 117.55]|uniref:Protein HRI1 n=1 Tax=Aspergillus heteromorphus CBS 117.55 TaxID=1448321 RepID=A0A317VP42_9EURO|nr:uncharacterized protein BO70DRAFT_364110 [Aspergillus heteromorphus CBS 117.55]PWY75021.1 hypothetical protein BO70DRAFT_364110 [Aspergillus heteromorphus CBS 117.55]